MDPYLCESLWSHRSIDIKCPNCIFRHSYLVWDGADYRVNNYVTLATFTDIIEKYHKICAACCKDYEIYIALFRVDHSF